MKVVEHGRSKIALISKNNLKMLKIGKNCLTHNNSSVTADLLDNYEINKNGKIFKRKSK